MFKLLKIDTPDFFYEEQNGNGKNYYIFIHKAIKKVNSKKYSTGLKIQ